MTSEKNPIGMDDNEVIEELERVKNQNEELKKQIEVMTHAQAKLAAKHQRYREERKQLVEEGLVT